MHKKQCIFDFILVIQHFTLCSQVLSPCVFTTGIITKNAFLFQKCANLFIFFAEILLKRFNIKLTIRTDVIRLNKLYIYYVLQEIYKFIYQKFWYVIYKKIDK